MAYIFVLSYTQSNVLHIAYILVPCYAQSIVPHMAYIFVQSMKYIIVRAMLNSKVRDFGTLSSI